MTDELSSRGIRNSQHSEGAWRSRSDVDVHRRENGADDAGRSRAVPPRADAENPGAPTPALSAAKYRALSRNGRNQPATFLPGQQARASTEPGAFKGLNPMNMIAKSKHAIAASSLALLLMTTTASADAIIGDWTLDSPIQAIPEHSAATPPREYFIETVLDARDRASARFLIECAARRYRLRSSVRAEPRHGPERCISPSTM
jgi:hypothetical protein